MNFVVPNKILGGRKSALRWLKECYAIGAHPHVYKKYIEISFGELTYVLMGCFPVDVGPETSEIVYDFMKIKEHT